MNTRAESLSVRFRSNAVGRPAAPVLTWRATEKRSKLVWWLLLFGFVVVLVRAFVLQMVNADQWQSRAEKRFERPREVPASRGRVLDRHGAVIASSVREEHLGIVPTRFHTAEAFEAAKREGKKPRGVRLDDPRIDKMAEIIGMKPSEVRSRILHAKRFFWLTRSLDVEQAEQIRKLGLEGLEFESDFRRYYPYGDAFAHIVGFTNAEEQGAEGIEAKQDSVLRGTPGQVRVVVDRRNNAVGAKTLAEPLPGKDLQLSLDASIQTIVQNALKVAVKEHRPKAVSAVVVDALTGEVLALANEPSFDPNNRKRLNPDVVRNRVVTDAFEPGSTMKAFSIAAALELKRVTPDSLIDTDTGKLTIGNRTIGDKKPLGVLTVSEVLAKSSNVGTVRISEKLKPAEMYGFYAAAGFGRVPDVGLNGATGGRMVGPQKWVPIQQATMSYGHGISVSLLQMARAYTIFARDGDVVPLSFLPQPGPVAGVPVISPQTAQAMRKMLQMATGPEGTAPLAQVPGFYVAGKTGTAHKPIKGGYAKNKYVASFVGFAPADKPRFVVAVMVDEPSGGKHYGGQVAAPIFAQIVNDTLRRMQISPNPALRVLPAVAMIEEGTE